MVVGFSSLTVADVKAPIITRNKHDALGRPAYDELEDFNKPVRKQSEKRRWKEATKSSTPRASVKGVAAPRDKVDNWVCLCCFELAGGYIPFYGDFAFYFDECIQIERAVADRGNGGQHTTRPHKHKLRIRP